jgi:hypothetical protein
MAENIDINSIGKPEQTCGHKPGDDEATRDATRQRLSSVALRRRVLQREMDLAWRLLETDDLQQDDYASIVEDLSQLVLSESHTTISLLRALSDRAYTGIDRVLQNMSRRDNIPFISMEAFELPEIDLNDFPLDYLLQMGVLPFAEMGGELLVGVLNPSNSTLDSELREYLGRKCHFYLVSPTDFDAAALKLTGGAHE